MKKKNRIIILLLSAVMLLTSCEGPSENADSVTLTIMGKKSDLEKSYMTSIFEQYEKATGNRLKLLAYEDAEFETAAADQFASGEFPDLFLHFHNADLKRFDIEKNFYYLNEEEWVNDLTDSALAYCQDSDQNLLGLPFWENSVSGCYYNKTILDRLGLKAATTQTEFDVLCQVLAETGYTPICWPGNGCSWMPQFGLDPVFADHPDLLEKLNKNEISYMDIPEVTAMVQWIADAAENGWFGSNYMDCSWDEISSLLTSGQAVMTFIWDTWFYTDLEKGQQYTPEDFALMPVFMNAADGGTYEGGNLNMMMVNKNSEHLETALDFLSFCASEENYNVAFDGISTVNCFKGQTTNIQSQMVTDASASIAAHERVSTAASKIIGYSADDMTALINRVLRGEISVDECVRLMDESRIAEARAQGIDGF